MEERENEKEIYVVRLEKKRKRWLIFPMLASLAA